MTLPSTRELINLRADSPCRPPDWRYRRAWLLLAHNRPLSRRWDTIETARILQVLDLRRSERAMPPDLAPYASALDVYLAADEARRAVLEARLLAAQAHEQIGQFLQLEPDVITAYGGVFFAVDPADNTSYVSRHVLGEGTCPEPTLTHILRGTAYAGGPLMLDDTLRLFNLDHLTMSPARPQPDAPIERELALRALLAAWLTPITPKTALRYLELNERWQRCTEHGLSTPRAIAGRRRLLHDQIALLRRALGRTRLKRYPHLHLLLDANRPGGRPCPS